MIVYKFVRNDDGTLKFIKGRLKDGLVFYKPGCRFISDCSWKSTVTEALDLIKSKILEQVHKDTCVIAEVCREQEKIRDSHVCAARRAARRKLRES